MYSNGFTAFLHLQYYDMNAFNFLTKYRVIQASFQIQRRSSIMLIKIQIYFIFTCSNLTYCTIFLYYSETCTLQLQSIWYLSIISPKYFHTHWNCKVMLSIIKINVWNKRPQLLIQNIKINMIHQLKNYWNMTISKKWYHMLYIT